MGYTDFSHQWVERFHKFLFTPCEFRFKLKFAGEVTEYQFKKKALEVSSVNQVKADYPAVIYATQYGYLKWSSMDFKDVTIEELSNLQNKKA